MSMPPHLVRHQMSTTRGRRKCRRQCFSRAQSLSKRRQRVSAGSAFRLCCSPHEGTLGTCARVASPPRCTEHDSGSTARRLAVNLFKARRNKGQSNPKRRAWLAEFRTLHSRRSTGAGENSRQRRREGNDAPPASALAGSARRSKSPSFSNMER